MTKDSQRFSRWFHSAWRTHCETITKISENPLSFGGTLISPNVPTWRRGDGTQSTTLDHVILVNFPDKTIRVTAEAMGDI
jgi:hypothetical protein